MYDDSEEIRVRGKTLQVPSINVSDRKVVIKGKWFKIAVVKDEDLSQVEAVDNPEDFIRQLRNGGPVADLFTFAQLLADTTPKYHQFHLEWDNAAVIPIRNYSDWWERRLPQETRRNVRRAAKMGVEVKSAELNDDLVQGIVDIYNETPVRQGQRFWHYGKSFETVKNELSSYPERSEFIGAYWNERLVGFCKLTYAAGSAHIIHILCKIEHQDKRPTNAIIAKAVEVCCQRRASYLVYCKYIYGKKTQSPLTEFKRRNGFEQLLYPRYFVPLTTKGRIILRLKLHHGLRELLPGALLAFLLNLRARCLALKMGKGIPALPNPALAKSSASNPASGPAAAQRICSTQ